MITKEIIDLLKSTFQLDWNGIHGVSHWSRVRVNGLMLAKDNASNTKVIELFAFFHDSMRISDIGDEMHGYRSAEFVENLPSDLLGLNEDEKKLLVTACRHHTDKQSDTKDITILTCWDADALDLGRIGIKPDPHRLKTTIARQANIIEWCYLRSIK